MGCCFTFVKLFRNIVYSFVNWKGMPNFADRYEGYGVHNERKEPEDSKVAGTVTKVKCPPQGWALCGGGQERT